MFFAIFSSLFIRTNLRVILTALISILSIFQSSVFLNGQLIFQGFEKFVFYEKVFLICSKTNSLTNYVLYLPNYYTASPKNFPPLKATCYSNAWCKNVKLCRFLTHCQPYTTELQGGESGTRTIHHCSMWWVRMSLRITPNFYRTIKFSLTSTYFCLIFLFAQVQEESQSSNLTLTKALL